MEVNKRFLIDTHIFIWWMGKSTKLSKKLFDLLNNPHNIIFLSTISAWEIILKKDKGKLKVPYDIQGGIEASGFPVLTITLPHILGLQKLPPLHNDPFDRMLIAQAQEENLTLITTDKKMTQYDVSLLKNE